MELISHKILALVVLGAISLFFGLLPLKFRRWIESGKESHRKSKRQTIISGLLCFGAGVLLATVFIHILPETRDGFERAKNMRALSQKVEGVSMNSEDVQPQISEVPHHTKLSSEKVEFNVKDSENMSDEASHSHGLEGIIAPSENDAESNPIGNVPLDTSTATSPVTKSKESLRLRRTAENSARQPEIRDDFIFNSDAQSSSGGDFKSVMKEDTPGQTHEEHALSTHEAHDPSIHEAHDHSTHEAHDHPTHEAHDHSNHEAHDHSTHEAHDHPTHEAHDHSNHEAHDHSNHEAHDHSNHEAHDHSTHEAHAHSTHDSSHISHGDQSNDPSSKNIDGVKVQDQDDHVPHDHHLAFTNKGSSQKNVNATDNENNRESLHAHEDHSTHDHNHSEDLKNENQTKMNTNEHDPHHPGVDHAHNHPHQPNHKSDAKMLETDHLKDSSVLDDHGAQHNSGHFHGDHGHLHEDHDHNRDHERQTGEQKMLPQPDLKKSSSHDNNEHDSSLNDGHIHPHTEHHAHDDDVLGRDGHDPNHNVGHLHDHPTIQLNHDHHEELTNNDQSGHNHGKDNIHSHHDHNHGHPHHINHNDDHFLGSNKEDLKMKESSNRSEIDHAHGQHLDYNHEDHYSNSPENNEQLHHDHDHDHDHGHEHDQHDHEGDHHGHDNGHSIGKNEPLHQEEHQAHDYPYAELFMCIGFFLIYVIEEIVHKIILKNSDHHSLSSGSASTIEEDVEGSGAPHSSGGHGHSHIHVPSIPNKKKKGMFGKNSNQVCHGSTPGRYLKGQDNLAFAGDINAASWNPNLKEAVTSLQELNGLGSSNAPATSLDQPDGSTNVRPTGDAAHYPEKSSLTRALFEHFRALLVILALSIHGVFEGLVVGLQETESDVWYIAFAISAHHVVISFCVGMELIIEGVPILLMVIYMVVLSLVAPVGTCIGILITGSSSFGGANHELVVAILQGLAGGTILYVVFLEILERERQKRGRSATKLICLLLGFAFMAVVEAFSSHSHGPIDGHEGHVH